MELGSNNIDTVRPGWPGWLDVIRGLRHNPVYHHIWRLRARRTLSVPWYKRNPVVLLFLGMAVVGMVMTLITATPPPGPVTFKDVLFQSWQVGHGFLSAIIFGWLVQAMYRYVHDTLGLLGRNLNPRLRSPVDDDLALASLDDRVILAGAFWAHYRALLPALAVVSLTDLTYGYFVEYYGAYAPPEIPDWLVTAFVYSANNLGGFLTNGLGALLMGLGLMALGSNLDNPRLQPVTGALVAFLTLFNQIGFNPFYYNRLNSWTREMSVPLTRLILVVTALCIVAVVSILLFAALKSTVVRRFLAWMVPGVAILAIATIALGFIPIYSVYGGVRSLVPDNLVFEFLVVLGSAFNCPNPLVSVIPVDTYYQCHYLDNTRLFQKDYLRVVWWYYPVLTVLQILLVAGLARFAAAAMALRRKAVR